jgi:hypothetical protein
VHAIRGQRRVFSNKVTVPTKYASWSMVLCNLLIPKTCWKCAFKTSRSCKRVRKNCVQTGEPHSTHTVRESPYMKRVQRAKMKNNNTRHRSLYSHVKNRVVTSEKAKSQRENESSLPAQPHDQKYKPTHSRYLLYAERSPHTCYTTVGR